MHYRCVVCCPFTNTNLYTSNVHDTCTYVLLPRPSIPECACNTFAYVFTNIQHTVYPRVYRALLLFGSPSPHGRSVYSPATAVEEENRATLSRSSERDTLYKSEHAHGRVDNRCGEIAYSGKPVRLLVGILVRERADISPYKIHAAISKWIWAFYKYRVMSAEDVLFEYLYAELSCVRTRSF